jgi:uncharacterized caspase-like protein
MGLKATKRHFGYRVRVLLSILLITLASFTDQSVADTRQSNSNRIALVIGNANYPEMPLRNPVNDAHAMAKALRDIGFEVIEKTDVSQKEMNRAITAFGEKLKSDSVALFYYAGHGMQVRGHNYLMPIDAQISVESSVKTESVDVDSVLEQITGSGSSLNIVILDACRNNPFERRFRGASGFGLAQMDAPKGTLIAYATSPGKTAIDGNDTNGLYTSELLKAFREPGMKVEDIFKTVRVHVAKATNDAQVPWESSSLTGDFYFREKSVALPEPPAKPANVATPVIDPATEELEVWKSARQLDEVVGYEDYLEQYPTGRHAKMAKASINKLKKKAELAETAAQAPAPPEKPAEVPPIKVDTAAPSAKPSSVGTSTGAVNTVPSALGGQYPSPGDYWKYHVVDHVRSRTNTLIREVLSVDKKGTTELIRVEEKPSVRQEIFIDNKMQLMEISLGDVIVIEELSPYLLAFNDLEKNKKWTEIPYVSETHLNMGWYIKVEVIGSEDITVPAGKFKAIKISVLCSRPWLMEWDYPIKITHAYWYVPETKRFVKETFQRLVRSLSSEYFSDNVEYELTEYHVQ